MSAPIHIVLADDSPTARALLGAIFEEAGGFRIIGEAGDGAEAVELAEQLDPDLIVMDVHMPVLDGIEATREIMMRSPRPILIVSSITVRDVDLSLTATQAGALLALPKPSGPGTPRFGEQCRDLVEMARAMASVKVVRHWRNVARPAPRSPVGRTTGGGSDIVALAASTGGPAALRALLDEMPSDFPAPMLLVQHIAHDFAAGFAEWLGGGSRLRVKLAERGERLLPGTLYVAPDDRHLGVTSERCADVSFAPSIGGFRPSADYLFENIGRVYGDRAIAVVLTGMGTDGADGIEAAHRAGTFVIAQDEASSLVFGMARAAIQRGHVDRVVPLDRIASHILGRVTGACDDE
ncbi:MAG: chemotaxis-specific protein-glutamate methyltransferase CheB [Longimicrobiales bacterium]